MRVIQGGCLCSSVTYCINDDLLYSGYCHCSECRRWTGSAFSATGGVKNEDFTLLSGRDGLVAYNKGESTIGYSCRKCGSVLYGDVPSHSMRFVMLGTLSESPTLKPQWHIYTNDKADWYEINDELKQYSGSPS